MLLRTAIAEGVDYVDLEEDIAAQIPRFGKTKRVVSFHDFRQTPEDLEELHERMCGMDPDVLKIATLANHPGDNFRMLNLVRQSKVPTVGLCMGDIGRPTRILCGRFGAPFSYATFHHERTLAPGQLSFEEMRDVYHYDEINGETDVYGVIGDPIGHSLSPLVHNAAFHSLGLNKVYVPFRVAREHLKRFLDHARELGIKGLSVTIPHKESVLDSLTKAEEAVQRIGAANTIEFTPDGLVGHNTDYRAAMDALEETLPATSADKSPLHGKICLVLGAGGVSKAIAHGLRRRGAHVVISSRTLARAEQLAKDADARAVDWDARHAIKADILVNGTPIGMHPRVDDSPYDARYLKPSMAVFDTVYNPETTLLVKEARERGCMIVTGVDMFIRQAALQFEMFTGKDAGQTNAHSQAGHRCREAVIPTQSITERFRPFTRQVRRGVGPRIRLAHKQV
ncbi:MAG: shikimate dehydrogenase [Pirellulales bacterium]